MTDNRFLRILFIFLGIGIFLWQTVPLGITPRHDNDFKHIYLGMKTLANGASPYTMASMETALQKAGMRPDTPINPYVYLPFTGLSFAPFYNMNIRQASNCLFWINIIATLLSLWFIAIACHDKSAPNLTPIAFTALCAITGASHPLMRTLTAGQLNCILLLALSAAFVLSQRKREVLAGIILGYAGMLKLAPFIFGFLFLLTRRYKALFAMIITAALLMLASILACGISVHTDFIPVLRDMSYGNSTWHEYGATFWKDPTNQSLNSFFTHIMVAGNAITTPWINLTQGAANLATWVCAAILIALWIQCSLVSHTQTANEAAFLLAIMLSLLFPSLLWDHYTLLTLIPAWWLLTYYWKNDKYVAMLTTFICLGILFMPWNFQAETFKSGWRVVLMSIRLAPMLIFYFMLTSTIIKTEKKVN